MITPEQIKDKAQKMLPKVLSAMIQGQSLFPFELRANKISSNASFETFRRELSDLLEHSKNKMGYGYKVEMREVYAGSLKGQSIPESILFETKEDFLKFVAAESDAQTCVEASEILLEAFPVLRDWCVRFPLKLIRHKDDWHKIIIVLQYFISNPRPNLFLRTLPVNVHTKFIEEHFSILDELLQKLLPEDSINLLETKFERRYYLRTDEPRIRLLLLDQSIAERYFSGCAELDLPISAISRLDIPVKRVFVMENKQSYSQIYNFLTLPEQENTAAIFGKGFSVGLLSHCKWLNNCQIYYWGDIDTHGLLILNRIRKHFPQTLSFLMDRSTLDAYREYWTTGADTPQEITEHLSPAEQGLFVYLKEYNVRLEQEKIRHCDVLNAICKLQI